jgi:hypothetical protein
MRNRIPSAVIGVVVMLATFATASGCASRSGTSASAGSGGQHTATQSAPADPSSPASSPSLPSMGGGRGGAAPNIPVVRLGTSFSPSTLQLGAGQQFVVIVGKSDKASGSGISGNCSAAQAAQFSNSMLSLRCDGSSYLYTTHKAGSTVLSVTVKPNCASGAMCPQWIAKASLHLNISSS